MECFWLAWEHCLQYLDVGTIPCQLPTDVGQERLKLQNEPEQSLAPVLRGESQAVLFTW